MTRTQFNIIAGFALVALFLSVNALSGVFLRGARLDLTEERLYTLSDGAQSVLADLSEPVDVTFFYSRALAAQFPQIRAHGARVRELLQAFAARSGGKLRLEELNPEPASEAEDRAIAAGIEAVPTADGETLYFGLEARNAIDERIVVPFFAPDRAYSLEYELARGLAELETPSSGRVGLWSSLDLTGARTGQPSYLYTELSRRFDLIEIEAGAVTLPEELSVLVLAHPPALTDRQLYLIDQFVIGGGRVFALIDPLSESGLQAGPNGLPSFNAQRSSDLGPLLAAWGLIYDPSEIVVDRERGFRIPTELDGRPAELPYPVWMSLPAEAMNADALEVSGLARGLTLASAGVLRIAEDAPAPVTALIETSDMAGVVDAAEVSLRPDPAAVLRDYPVELGPQVLAARVDGITRSAFPDGPPLDGEGAPPAAAGPAETGGAVLVVTDTDLLDDGFYVSRDPLFGASPIADNASFVANVVDLFTGSAALVGLRSRAPTSRPMERVEALRADAEALFLDEQASLEAQLEASNARLQAIQDEGAGSGFFAGDRDAELSDEELSELDRVRAQITEIRARQRQLSRDFRADIVALETTLAVFNIALTPILVIAVGLAVFVQRRRRGARRIRGALL
ncbi:MAG: Gldg family protein [Maricaulaceae bacterium]